MPSYTYAYAFWTDYLSEQPEVNLFQDAMVAIQVEATSLNTVSRMNGGLSIQVDCLPAVLRQAMVAIEANCLSLPLVMSDDIWGEISMSGDIAPFLPDLSHANGAMTMSAMVPHYLVDRSSQGNAIVGVTPLINPFLVAPNATATLGLGVSADIKPELVEMRDVVPLSLGVSGEIGSIPSPVSWMQYGIGIEGLMSSGPPPGSDAYAALSLAGQMDSRSEASFTVGLLAITPRLSSISLVSPQAGQIATSASISPFLLSLHEGLGAVGIYSFIDPYLLSLHPGEYNLSIAGEMKSQPGTRSDTQEAQVSIGGSFAIPPQLTLHMNHAYSLGAE
jgi:hypothetical protein